MTLPTFSNPMYTLPAKHSKILTSSVISNDDN